MTDAPLRANPPDRPLPPSGDIAATDATSGASDAVPAAAPAKSPTTPVAAPAAAARPGPVYVRPIGRPAKPPQDWRRAWSGFFLGVAVVVVAIGLTWLLWDQAGAPKMAGSPAAQMPATDLAEMETLLDGIGFPPGEIDGVIDDDATLAIRDFQTMAGLPVDGRPSAALLEELRAAQIELTGGQ